MLRYAHDAGCPWDEDTCCAAAENGHLDVLRYAREAGCPCGEAAALAARAGGDDDVIRFMLELGWPAEFFEAAGYYGGAC